MSDTFAIENLELPPIEAEYEPVKIEKLKLMIKVKVLVNIVTKYF
jgi:hypothetical protein